MKKILIYILTIFAIFLGINNVEAANSCYYMLGENNKFVVPKGYTARCFYEFSLSESNITTPGFKYLQLEIDDDTTIINGTSENTVDANLTRIVSFGNNFSPTTAYKNTFNGIDLTNKDFGVVEFDKNINGCPESVYMISNGGSGHIDYVVGLSSSSSPSVSYGEGAKKSVYRRTWSDGDADIYFEPDNSNDWPIIYYEDEDNDSYNDSISSCSSISQNSNRNSTTQQSGSDHHAIKDETLVTCKYYIGLSSSNGECGVISFDISLIKSTKDGVSTYKYNSVGSGIDFNNLKNAIGYANNGSFDDLYGFFSYKNNKWSCYDTLYSYVNPQTAVSTLYGQNKYNDLINNYGEDNTKLVTTVKDDNCDTVTEKKAKEREKDEQGRKIDDCKGLIGDNTLKLLNLALNFLMIIGPIIALVLGTYDLVVALANGEEDAKKKGIKKMKNRLIAAALLLLLPYIVKLVLNIAGRGGTDCIEAMQNLLIFRSNI